LKNSRLLGLAILALALVFTMTVVGCETEDDKGPLGGTTLTRSVGVGYAFKISGDTLTSMTSSGTVEWTKN